MSKRTDFTTALAKLISLGNKRGMELILDWTLRDAHTQQWMFDRGLSECDGTKKRSKHQFGLAADLYVLVDRVISKQLDDYEWLHDQWEKLGGNDRIIWDMGHFEWKE